MEEVLGEGMMIDVVLVMMVDCLSVQMWSHPPSELDGAAAAGGALNSKVATVAVIGVLGRP